jgi:hypothetical protein
MKRFRIIGLSLLALFALGALAASSASATEGFLPLKVKTFTILSKSGATLEPPSAENPPFECKEAKGTGTFETDSHGKTTLDLEGCTVLTFPANSLGDKGGLVLLPLLFLVCLINSAALTFGIFFELTEPVHVDIPALAGVLLTYEGAFIGELDVKAGVLLKLFELLFHGKKGVQNVKQCVDDAGNIKKGTFKFSDPKPPELVSVDLEVLVEFAESEELMDK